MMMEPMKIAFDTEYALPDTIEVAKVSAPPGFNAPPGLDAPPGLEFMASNTSSKVPLSGSAAMVPPPGNLSLPQTCGSPKAATEALHMEASLRAAMFRNQKAAIEVEHAKLNLQNAQLRLQAQRMNMPMQYAMQAGYGYGPWGSPMAAYAAAAVHFGNMSPQGTSPKNTTPKSGDRCSSNKTPQKTKKECSFGFESVASDSTTSGSSSSAGSVKGDEPDDRTTIMMRNIPNNLSRDQLVELLNDSGFEGKYDLVYVPIDFKNKVGLGYAFVNLSAHDDAEAFRCFFQGFKSWNIQTEKVCEVTWSDTLQGLEAHLEKYRNSFVMHESIADEFKPILLANGKRVPFPAPTKQIRVQRPWSRRH